MLIDERRKNTTKDMTASAQGRAEHGVGFDLGLDIDLVFVSVDGPCSLFVLFRRL